MKNKYLFCLCFFCGFFCLGCGGSGNADGKAMTPEVPDLIGQVFTEPRNGSYITENHDIFFFVSAPGWLEYQVNNDNLKRVYIDKAVSNGDFDRAFRLSVSGKSGQNIQLDYRFTDIYGNPDITERRVFYVSEISSQEPIVISELVEKRSQGLISGSVIGESLAVFGQFILRE